MVKLSEIKWDRQFFVILIIAIAIVLLLVFFQNVEIPTFTNETQNQDFHGSSTKGRCTSSSDCIITGCNLEICQTKFEEPLVSTCEYNPPYPKDKGYHCLCIINQCEWSK